MYIYKYIYTETFAYMHAYIHTNMHADMHTFIQTYIHTCKHTYICFLNSFSYLSGNLVKLCGPPPKKVVKIDEEKDSAFKKEVRRADVASHRGGFSETTVIPPMIYM